MDPNTYNTYPTLAQAHMATLYFSRLGFTVRPGGPVETPAGWLVAMTK